MGWALDGGEDIGGQEADRDMAMQQELEMFGILEDRRNRVKTLAGKFVVSTKGKGSGRTVFFQNQRVCNKGYWTQYLSNAQGLTTIAEANSFAKRFKYGDPKVAFVTSEGNYQWMK